jgi:hypothetical protein
LTRFVLSLLLSSTSVAAALSLLSMSTTDALRNVVARQMIATVALRSGFAEIDEARCWIYILIA